MKVTFIGSGAWATALANVITDNKYEVAVYGIIEDEVNDINFNHKNSKYFPQVELNQTIKATLNLDEALKDAKVIVLAVPSNQITTVLRQIENKLTTKPIIVNVAKGFNPLTHERLSVTIKNSIKKESIRGVCSLIGPSHAEEVIIKLYTAICAVSADRDIAKAIQDVFSNHYFRVYINTDEIGAEYGAASKNVIALAVGIVSGLNYGDNTKAALMTRGLAEIARFGEFKGGDKMTFLGLTGLGDLIVTCSSKHSRNFMAGYQIGLDNNVDKFMKENHKTVEGILACKILHEEAIKEKIEMPIVQAIYRVLFENSTPAQEIDNLMQRTLKDE